MKTTERRRKCAWNRSPSAIIMERSVIIFCTEESQANKHVTKRYSGSGIMVNLGIYIYVHCFQTLSFFSHLVMWSYEYSPVKQLIWFIDTKTDLCCLNSKHNICRKMSNVHHPSIPNMKQSGVSIVLWECFSTAEAGRLVSVEQKS